MTGRNWDKARRRARRDEDWSYRKLGAQTPKRAAYNRDVQARLRREAAARRRRRT